MKVTKTVWIVAAAVIIGALLATALPLGALASRSQAVAEEKDVSYEAVNEAESDGDSDGDGISDYDEINGFTWGNETYFTNPIHSSTDQDPYDDYMEITGIEMPPAVLPPGRHPCVPAWPDLSVEVSGIDVWAKCKIISTETKEEGDSWSIETEAYERTKTDWGVDTEFTIVPPFIKLKPYYHNEHEAITVTKTSESGWSREEWSRAVAVEPDKAGRLEVHLKIKNRGTDAAKNIELQFNVRIGGDKVVDTVWTDIVIYSIGPNETSAEMVIDHDKDGEIVVTLEELKSIECGASITIEVTDIKADVPWYEGYINWDDFIRDINRVSSTIMADFGDGQVRDYKVWSGINLGSPEPDDYWHDITLRDGIDRTLGIREDEGDVYIGWKVGKEVNLEDWTFGFDEETFQQIKDELPEDWTLDNLLNIFIKQGWVVVMKAPDIKPPEIHWAIFSKDLKTIMASVTDNESIESVIAHVKVWDEYIDIELMDEDQDTVFEANLLDLGFTERIIDTEDDYIVASDGKFDTVWENIGITTPREIHVDDDMQYPDADFDSIQPAVDDAEEGDIVIVHAGIYMENVDVDKGITIQSESGPGITYVLAAIPGDHVFDVTADYVTIAGFTVLGATQYPYAGIYLTGSDSDNLEHCNISDNIAMNNRYGIYLYYSSNNSLDGNTATDNDYGVYLSYSSGSILTNNTILENKYNFGVTGYYSHTIATSNTINGKPIQYLVGEQDLVINSSWDVGYLGIVNCTNITAKDLTLTNNYQGLLLANSSDSRIENINVSNNRYGIYLYDSPDNTITDNTASKNVYAIHLRYSSNNTITKNHASSNSYGIYVWYSSENEVYLNNFVDSTSSNVYSGHSTNIWNSPDEVAYPYNGSTYQNYLGNYWSDYTGVDADNDGIGDGPYPIDVDSDNYPLMATFENYSPSTFSFRDDFSIDTGMWRYVGNAYRDSESEYVVLTEDSNYQVGAIWFDRVISVPFVIDFKYKAGGGTGSDGLVFMFNKQADYTPANGGRLGFVDSSGYVPGYGIEFDNWHNSEYSDPSSNHVALIKDRVSNHLTYANDVRVEDNQWHNVKVSVENCAVKVDIDGDRVLVWGLEIDRSFAGMGFSGATGSRNNWHIIDDVKITTTPPPAVTTNEATNVTATSATLNGNLIAMGAAQSVDVSFEWGTAAAGELLGTYDVGREPWDLVFDGANIWVTSEIDDKVVKLRASDGNLLGIYPVGDRPTALLFDGTSIWVANDNSNNVMKLRTSDGHVLGTYPVGTDPTALAFDGANIWVANFNSNNLMKLSVSDGTLLGTYPVGSYPRDLAFDGANIWVANQGSDNVMKLRASDGTLLGTYPMGNEPRALAFDGASIWVANQESDNVMKIRVSDGALLGTYSVADGPWDLAFDGANIWVTNKNSDNVMKLRASDGVRLGTFPVGNGPHSLAFDGENVWVSNQESDNVMKIRASYKSETIPQAMTITGPFTSALGGLDPGTTYHFRAKALGDGTAYGEDMTFTSTSCIPGDANMDGVVNMADVTYTELIILGYEDPTCGADCSRDGDINMGDVVCIELKILGLWPPE